MLHTRVGSLLGAALLGLGAGLATGLAEAEEVYRWVDADGVVHFSDKPPASAQAGVTTMAVDSQPPASYDPDEDRYNVEATAARTQALRDEQAQAREARRQQNATAPSVVQYPQSQAYAVDYGYLPPYNRPGFRPPLRPRPPPPSRPEPERPPTDTLRPPRESRN